MTEEKQEEQQAQPQEAASEEQAQMTREQLKLHAQRISELADMDHASRIAHLDGELRGRGIGK